MIKKVVARYDKKIAAPTAQRRPITEALTENPIALMNTWIPTKSNFYSTSRSLYFKTFSMKSNPFFKAFIRIYYFPKFHCHILGPWKVTALEKWRAAQFLTVFNKFSLRHLWNHKCYRLFSEACFKIPNLLPSSQKDTFVTHIVLKLTRFLLFLTIKDWWISKSDVTILYLRKWMLVNGKSVQA